MKKKLLGILILPTLVMAGITEEGSNQKKSFEQKIYTTETHRSTALNVMYGLNTNIGEISGEKTSLKESVDGDNYSALELMYAFGTGSKKMARVNDSLKTDAPLENAPLALELMYSRIS